MTQTYQIKNILDKAKILVNKNNEIAKILNEDFNIFSILRKEYDEVQLHSAFIKELLDPSGSHNSTQCFCRPV